MKTARQKKTSREKMNNRIKRFLITFLLFFSVLSVGFIAVNATAPPADPEEPAGVNGTTEATTASTEAIGDGSSPFSIGVTLDANSSNGTLAGTLQMLLVLTVISIAPSILVMMTSFTRIVVVLHFVRTALGTQSTPPNNVLIGLSLFLTLFIMSPVLTSIYDNGITPLAEGKITQKEAIENCMEPLREFMFKQVKADDVRLFMNIADMEPVEELSEIPTQVLVPSFILSELRAAFIIGFLIYIPFIIIDMVVSSTLMAMGMMMLPPTTISMPFKLLLFVLVDGWDLVIEQLVKSFNF